jgi:hypothetical protein
MAAFTSMEKIQSPGNLAIRIEDPVQVRGADQGVEAAAGHRYIGERHRLRTLADQVHHQAHRVRTTPSPDP